MIISLISHNHFYLHTILIWVICFNFNLNWDKTIVNAKNPSEIDRDALIPGTGLFCEGCYAVIDILIEEFTENNPDLKGPYRINEKWEELKENLCDTNNIKKYVYSPPKMAKVSIVM